MQVVPLRARSICQLCDSKLPPRTEAWWDEETKQATCLSCVMALEAEAAASLEPAEVVEPSEAVLPPVVVEVPFAPVEPEPVRAVEVPPAASVEPRSVPAAPMPPDPPVVTRPAAAPPAAPVPPAVTTEAPAAAPAPPRPAPKRPLHGVPKGPGPTGLPARQPAASGLPKRAPASPTPAPVRPPAPAAVESRGPVDTAPAPERVPAAADAPKPKRTAGLLGRRRAQVANGTASTPAPPEAPVERAVETGERPVPTPPPGPTVVDTAAARTVAVAPPAPPAPPSPSDASAPVAPLASRRATPPVPPLAPAAPTAPASTPAASAGATRPDGLVPPLPPRTATPPPPPPAPPAPPAAVRPPKLAERRARSESDPVEAPPVAPAPVSADDLDRVPAEATAGLDQTLAPVPDLDAVGNDVAVLHHDFDESSIGVGEGADLLAPAPTAVPVPNGHRAVDLLAPPKPAPGEVVPQIPAEMLDRGQPGDGEVGLSLEAARKHGLEVVHGFRAEGCPVPIDHLVLAVNGIWVVDAVDVLTGKLERRDEGDWFTADPRLHIGGADHTYLVAAVRDKVEAVAHLLARTDFTDIPVRGVLCFGTIQPGWVSEPFVLDGVTVTWERKLIEPLLDPILIDQPSRNALLQELVASQGAWTAPVPAELEAG